MGESLIQPVLASDVVKAIRACIDNHSSIGKTIAVPGKSPTTYRRFVELCIELSGEKVPGRLNTDHPVKPACATNTPVTRRTCYHTR